MRHGRQTCEGADRKDRRPCLSQAHWKVTFTHLWNNGVCIFELWHFEVFLCTTCHAANELDWAERAVPRKTEYSEVGWEMQPGHEDAVRRHARAFSNGGRKLAKQLTLIFNDHK
jgi:hypothetical protein